MPKIYFIPLLFTGSFAGDSCDHLRLAIISGSVQWNGGSATILSIIMKYKGFMSLIW